MKARDKMMGFLEKIFNAAFKLVKEKLNMNTNCLMIDEVFMLNHICKSQKRHTTNQRFKTQTLVRKTRSLAKNNITIQFNTNKQGRIKDKPSTERW